MTEPYTTGFGAVPRPEEPEREGWTPPPVPQDSQPYPASYGLPPQYAPPQNHWGPAHYNGPAANASVVNQIRIGGHVRRCNHVLHATLTLLTCGLWAPVWLVAWLVDRQYR